MPNNNAITPHQRRLEHWEIMHVRQTMTSGADKISNTISKNTKKMIETANKIVVSQDRIARGIDDLSIGVDRLSNGVESLKSMFYWGFSEIVWQLEQQRDLLINIKEILEAPLDTQAKELKKRAEEAYKNGWMEDALEDFLESEKINKYDFIVHQYIGNIYFFEKKNLEKSLSYCEKALKYSTPKSNYHASLALLHIGLINYIKEDFQKAIEATSEAIRLSPKLLEAYYQHAQYCAVQGNYGNAIQDLEIAIKGDKYYCLKAETEEDFSGMKNKLNELFEKLRDSAKEKAQKEIGKARKYVKDAKNWDAETYTFDSGEYKLAEENLREAESFFERNSYFDYLDASSIAIPSQKKAIGSLRKSLSKQITNLRIVCSKESSKDEKKKNSMLRAIGWIVFLLFIPIWIMLKSFYFACLISFILYCPIFLYSKTPFKRRESYEEDITNLENKLSRIEEED